MLLRWILIPVGACLIVAGFTAGRTPYPPPPGTVRAEGKVTGTATQRTAFGTFETPVITFTPEGGELTTITLGEPGGYRIGQRVVVDYEAYDPGRSWSLPMYHMGLASFALIALGIVVIVAAFLIKPSGSG